MHLKHGVCIASALVLDFDLHHGAGTVNGMPWVTILNPEAVTAAHYGSCKSRPVLGEPSAFVIGVSASFGNRREDWGGMLATAAYQTIERMVQRAARRSGGGCCGAL